VGYGAGFGPGYGAGRGTGYGAGRVGYGAGTGTGYGAGPGASGGAAAFSPSDLANYELDLDFSDVTQLWQDSGRTTPVAVDTDPIGACDDKSGNARHATQATAGKRATYRTAQFGAVAGADFVAASSQSLATSAFTVNQPGTVYLVADFDVQTFFALPFDGITSRWGFGVTNDPGFPYFLHAGANGVSGTNSDASPHVFAIVFNGASSNLRIDGGAGTVLNPSTDALTTVRIGNDSGEVAPFDGRIGRAIVYAGAHTTTELNQVGQYLADIFGTTWTTAT
jgi:hypothetical protein